MRRNILFCACLAALSQKAAGFIAPTIHVSSSLLSSRARVVSMVATPTRPPTKVQVVPATGKPKSPIAQPLDHDGILTPCELYANAVDVGQRKAKLVTKYPLKTLVLGLIAGAYISMGGLFAVTVGANLPGLAATNPGLQRLIYGAVGLPLGLFFVMVLGGELFTGNTAMLSAAVKEGRATWKQLFMNWGISFSANLIASVAMAYIVFKSSVVFNPAAAASMAVYKTNIPFLPVFLRGILCNWLVCMAVWMAAGTKGAADKLVTIMLPITMFTAIGFEHSVANMFLIPLGMFHGAPVSIGKFLLRNLLPVTLGNIIGGVFGLTCAYSVPYGDIDAQVAAGALASAVPPSESK